MSKCEVSLNKITQFKQIMDADDATSALIAQMLAADYAAASAQPSRPSISYGYQYSDEEYGEDEADHEFGSRKKKKRKSKAKSTKSAPKSKKSKKTSSTSSTRTKVSAKSTSVQSSDSSTAAAVSTTSDSATRESTGKAASKTTATTSTTKKLKSAPRKWTAEEEKLFLEALELHGRDWAKCVEHMKHVRNRQSFTSHAQKHFIKLYRDDLPLPKKVMESGEGYTLSGKPLDKDSAAARAYGASGVESQASYRKMIKLRKDDPKVVMLELARCNLIQFGKAFLYFFVFFLFFIFLLFLSFILSFFYCQLLTLATFLLLFSFSVVDSRPCFFFSFFISCFLFQARVY